MSYTPFNAPLLSSLLGDLEIAGFFSVQAELDAMIFFEKALAEVEGELGIIPGDASKAIVKACNEFQPDITALGAGAANDGMVVPNLIQQLSRAVGEPFGEFVHFGSTSQDVIDTSLMLRLKEVDLVLRERARLLAEELEKLKTKFGEHGLMARTRMKSALQITVGERVELWVDPLRKHLQSRGESEPVFNLQFSGPVGNLEKLEEKAPLARQLLAKKLGLQDPGRSWHTDRSSIAAFVNWSSLITATLGKLGKDLSLMAQDEFAEVEFSAVGCSSAMPHKQNPVRAEVLVTLAQFNATLASGISHSLVHEQERSGSSWTLEWMLVPQLCTATGASLRNALELISTIQSMGGKEV